MKTAPQKKKRKKKMACTVFNLLQKLYSKNDKYLSKLIFNVEIFSIYSSYNIYGTTVQILIQNTLNFNLRPVEI